MIQKIVKQQVRTSAELKVAFQKLIKNEIDLIWAEDIKCSPEEFKKFTIILNQIKNVNWIYNIAVRMEKTGNKMFLEIKRKKGNVMIKYEKFSKIEYYQNEEVFEEKYDIDDDLPDYVNISGFLYKKK